MRSKVEAWRNSTAALLERLRNVNPTKSPVIDRQKLHQSFDEHFGGLNLPTRSIQWVPDPRVNEKVLAKLIGRGSPDSVWSEAIRATRQKQREEVDAKNRKHIWYSAGVAGRRAIQAMRWYGVSFGTSEFESPIEGPSVYEAGEAVAIEEALWDHRSISRWRSI